MDSFDPATFGALNAEGYDATQTPDTTQATIKFLSQLYDHGRILELAIGTGRIALPLSLAGHDISGIEGSPEMLEILRGKPGGQGIPVVIGDMADVNIEGRFDHAFLIYNTLFNLQSQQDQIRCFANTADRLNPKGTFLIEAFVPDLSGFTDNQRMATKSLSASTVILEAAKHDPVQQVFEFQRIHITQNGFRLVPLPMRYAWPCEIDLMARLAGLTLEHRWGGWDKRPFDAESKLHVSLYRKI